MCPKPNHFEFQLPVASFRLTETLFTGNLTLSTHSAAHCAEHLDSNSGRRASRGDHGEMTRQSLCCPRVEGGLDEGKDEGLIEFEVGGGS